MNSTLITGGAGFIGAHVARELLKRGDSITILDDFNNRYDPRLKEARLQHLCLEEFQPEIVRGDIRNRDLIDNLFTTHRFQQVIHLAAWASVRPSIKNPYIYTEVNINGTVNILEAARKHNVENMVFASSSSVYGGISDVPFSESADVSRPISPYAATKVAGEILCATWHHLYDLPISALRFFTVYGPWGRPEMAMFTFAEALRHDQPILMRGRTTERDFTYIDDIVAGVIAAVDRPRGYAVYNLGEHDAVPLPRMISALETAFHKKAKVKEVPLPPGDIPRTLADITKAQQELNYQPTTSIEVGAQKFAQWYNGWYVSHLAER